MKAIDRHAVALDRQLVQMRARPVLGGGSLLDEELFEQTVEVWAQVRALAFEIAQISPPAAIALQQALGALDPDRVTRASGRALLDADGLAAIEDLRRTLEHVRASLAPSCRPSDR